MTDSKKRSGKKSVKGKRQRTVSGGEGRGEEKRWFCP